MNFNGMSEKAALKEVGRRLQVQRLNLNWPQETLARKAGVSRRALQNLESGRGCTLLLFIRLLCALGKLDQLDALFPEPGVSPIQLAKLKGRERLRASGRHAKPRAGES